MFIADRHIAPFEDFHAVLFGDALEIASHSCRMAGPCGSSATLVTPSVSGESVLSF